MKEAKFKIDDHVKTNTIANIEGFVIDVLWSESTGWTYRVQENNHVFFLPENDLELVPEKKDYSMDIKIDIANNVVIATLYESGGGVQMPLRKGHGHLIHEGDVGIAQAASYACMRLYKSMGGYER